MTKPTVHYTVTPFDVSGHYYQVTLTVPTDTPDGHLFTLPTWIPGSYLIREFAKNILSVRATDADNKPVAIKKSDKATWRSAPCTGSITLHYTVYAWDLSVRTAHLDDTHGFFNGTSLFLCPVGLEDSPVTLDICLPNTLSHWEIATTLTTTESHTPAMRTYQAENYDELIDHPVEMGTHSVFNFSACGVVHTVAITGRHNTDTTRLARDLKTICEYHIGFFGEPAPVDEYLFLVHAVGSGYGGLEHRRSTALICNRSDLPIIGDATISDGYRRFLGLCSHEYLHTWNVKRIKPAAYLPYDLSKEAMTRLLWVFEGITSYFDDLALRACGIIDTQSYLALLGQQITNVTKTPGRHNQTLAESSYDTWIKLYRADENSQNANISYYTKGAIVALALDLTLRKESTVTLPDTMRVAWKRYGDQQMGMDEGAFEALVQEISGLDLTDFFQAAIRSTTDLPLAKLLKSFGILLTFRSAQNTTDKGGKSIAVDKLPKAALQVTAVKGGGGAKLRIVHNGGPAHSAGLSAGDVIVAIDGLRVNSPTELERACNQTPGTTLVMTSFRADIMRTTSVITVAPPHTHAVLSLDESADDVVSTRRKNWLSAR